MLSFLQDQELEDVSGQKASGAGGSSAAEADKQKDEQQYLTVSAHNKTVRNTTMLLAALFVIGLLCLLFMIKKSTPQTASAELADTEETQIEQAITRLTGIRSEMFQGLERIVNKFYEFSDVQQVKVDELAKNPFKLELFLDSLKGISDSEEGGFRISPEMIRQQQLQGQAEKMQLLSIMQSEQGNCCMIDDRILYEADSIKGFTVRQIGDSFVKLVETRKPYNGASENQPESIEIILKLSE